MDVSTSRWPDLSLRTLFGSPAKPCIPFDIVKGDSFAIDFSAHVPSIIKNRGQIELSVSESESSGLSRFVREGFGFGGFVGFWLSIGYEQNFIVSSVHQLLVTGTAYPQD